MLCVQWRTPDDGQKNCPKHVEFYYKNKFEKLVHLVGFVIRIYNDARSPERQIKKSHVWRNILIWFPHSQLRRSRNGAVTRLRLRRSRVKIPAGAKDVSHLQNVQTGSGTHAASSCIRTGGCVQT